MTIIDADDIETSTLCPEGHRVVLSHNRFEWTATCDCYDGAEDAGPQLCSHGKTPGEALDSFVEREEELYEVEWHLDDLFGDIAKQVSIEAEQAQGWILTEPSPEQSPPFRLYGAGLVRLMRDELAQHATHRFQP